MASIFSHAIAAGALGSLNLPKKDVFKFFALGIFCASFPDADVLAFKFGIPYDHPFGHRGFTHSILFAFLQGLFLVRVFYFRTSFFSKRSLGIGFYFFCCGVSHSILDAMTNGGLGVAFFAPFDNTRYFFPWRPIQVSSLNVDRFFGQHGIDVLKSEFYYVMLPSLMLMAASFGIRKYRDR